MRFPGQLALSATVSAFLLLTSQPALAFDPDLVAYEKAHPKPTVSSKEMTCLANAIYFEARGESESGQEAVGQVILNRTTTGFYPKSICGVVYQNKNRRNACQFSFACDGKPDIKKEKAAWRRAQRIAREVTSGEKHVAALETATHYHATYAKPKWAKKLKRLSKIGRHIFYHEDR
jgi:spore germination cell wall hydrolase CwlJ-like protein